MNFITIAICSYNGGQLLPSLVEALRALETPCPAEILVIDNNSTDDTAEVAAALTGLDGIPLRYCFEPRQGIVHARNRAIEESLKPGSDSVSRYRDDPTRGLSQRYLAFIDVDELPCPGWLNAALNGFERDQADCVGGEIQVRFPACGRPAWLEDDLMGFLGELNNGSEPLWVKDLNTPVWSGNIAYRLSLFGDGLRFDLNFNRVGEGIGGGEDAAMLLTLLEQGIKVRYRPDMAIEHRITAPKLRRGYFLRLHYLAGMRFGRYQLQQYDRTVLGIAPFTIGQLLRHLRSTLMLYLKHAPGRMRQAMTTVHALGSLRGQWQRWRLDERGGSGPQ